MYPARMVKEVGFLVESLTAENAVKGLFARVDPHVGLKFRGVQTELSTDRAPASVWCHRP